MSTSDRLAAPKEYAAPRLVIYGGMVALTAGGSKGDPETSVNMGSGMQRP
jgi:hypothetical protein